MSKKRLGLLTMTLVSLAIGSILLAACTRPGAPAITSSTSGGGSTPTSSSGGGAAVHMGTSSFLVPGITIPKGSMLTLIDDAQVPHIIKNGTYDASGTAKPLQEPGAPTVSQNFTGGDTHQIGPFSTAGTFHIYCTIHPNMDLTITVK